MVHGQWLLESYDWHKVFVQRAHENQKRKVRFGDNRMVKVEGKGTIGIKTS